MFFFLVLISFGSAGKILIFNPSIGHSHVRFLGNLADLFAENGHDVTVFSPVIDDHVEPVGTSNPKVNKIIYHSKYVSVDDWKTVDIKLPTFWKTPIINGLSINWEVWNTLIKTTSNIYRGLLEDKQMMEFLIDQKFDLGVLELFELGGVALFEVLGIRVSIAAAALGMITPHYKLTGIPYFPSFTPDFISTFDGEMTFWERLINLRANWQLIWQMHQDVERVQEIFTRHYPNLPSINKIMMNQTSIIFSNTNEFTESPRIKSNMIQYVGGTNVHTPKPLSKEIEDILNIRDSTVFLSFGSFVQVCTMPIDIKLEILEAFSHFPEITFLWKYENCDNDTTPLHLYTNVITRKWFPQTDLLGHPRVKGFITHAGMNSLLEASYRGKPLITIPLFADQFINAKNAARLGHAIMLERTNITRDSLTTALRRILIRNSPVAEKASLIADVLKGKEDEYRKEALRWVNLLCKYGPLDHLQLPTTKLNFFQLYSLDCLAFLATVATVSFLFVYFILKQLSQFSIRIVRSRTDRKKNE